MCPGCEQEMIHRDFRKPWESASSFGQIMWRRGPKETSCGDVDLYVDTRFGFPSLFRIIERMQPQANIKSRQRPALTILDQVIKHAVQCPLFNDMLLFEQSGVFIIQGNVHGWDTGNRHVDFFGPQIVHALDGTKIFETSGKWDHEPLFSWLIGHDDWHRRDNKSRLFLPPNWRSKLEEHVKPKLPNKSAFDAIQKLLPKLSRDEKRKLLEQLKHEKPPL
jgi:hypothetical protein